MIPEHARAVLTRDIPELGLKPGDAGVVIHVHRAPGASEPSGYMLELFTVDGTSIDGVSVPANSIRIAGPYDRMHAWPVAVESLDRALGEQN